MYIKEFENIEVVLTHYSQPTKWEKTLGFKPELNKTYLIHWSNLKTKSRYRDQLIKIKCDDCEKIFNKKIENLNPKINIHYCRKCQNRGERNGMFGKPINEKFKNSQINLIKEKGNPFTWDSTKRIIKEKLEDTIKKIVSKTTGQCRSDDTKLKMSLSALKSFKEGRRKPNSGWGKVLIKKYKEIDYQSTYELNFLKYMESQNKLDLIERGPRISYFDVDKKEHSYYIDYKIKGTNIVLEIKSSYIWDKHKTTNEIKQQTAEKLYYYFLILDNNFEHINKILKQIK